MRLKTDVRPIAANVILLLWTICLFNTASSMQEDLQFEFMTEIEVAGRKIDEDSNINIFDNATAPTSTNTSTSAAKNTFPLANGDFESCNATMAPSTLVTDNTSIPNWTAGQAGVQILNGNTYQMSSFAKGVFAVHLNNPASTGNGTQGSLLTTLTPNPQLAKMFTLQFDCARNPDGPLNLLPAMKLSAIAGTTITTTTISTAWEIREPVYNSTDSQKQITWHRFSFVFIGVGMPLQLKLESMSEKYGPIVDNLVILTGFHPLSKAAPPPPVLPQFVVTMTIATAMMVAVFT